MRMGIAAVVMVVSRLMLILLAGRLPEGTAKEPARFLPACVTTVRRLRSKPAVPRRAKIAVGSPGCGSSPDRPDSGFPGDRSTGRRGCRGVGLPLRRPPDPRDVLLDAWPGDRRTIERLSDRSARLWMCAGESSTAPEG
jgi:hypothetical protein